MHKCRRNRRSLAYILLTPLMHLALRTFVHIQKYSTYETNLIGWLANLDASPGLVEMDESIDGCLLSG